MNLSITQSQIFTVLRNFILSVVPSGVEVFRAQINRVPEPSGTDFVEMTPIFQERLATNIDILVEALFVGSITATTLTITSVLAGALSVGSQIYGNGISANTFITALGTGTGGTGTYTVNNSQTFASGLIQAGTSEVEQYTQVTVQLDVHGPSSADNAQVITTLFRDQYATQMFYQSGFDMAPLYTSDPRQSPFINGEQQYEDRWTIDLVLQANPVLSVPLQFAVELGPVALNEIS